MLNLWPIACLPYARALKTEKEGACFDEFTPYVKLHNKALAKVLQKLEKKLKGFRYSISDFNEFLTQRMNHPSKYGINSIYICFVFLMILLIIHGFDIIMLSQPCFCFVINCWKLVRFRGRGGGMLWKWCIWRNL